MPPTTQERSIWRTIGVKTSRFLVLQFLLSNSILIRSYYSKNVWCQAFTPFRRLVAKNEAPRSRLILDQTVSLKPKDPRNRPVGLYIHIPWCRRRCRYCNFSIVPIGDQQSKDDAKDSKQQVGSSAGVFAKLDEQYLNALKTELKHIARDARKQGTPRRIRLRSLYFGGGTPSLAPVETIAAILEAAVYANDSPFELQADAEVSMEMDPGTFSRSQLIRLQELGINRISLGVQSFDDDLLESIGRFHRRRDILESVKMIRDVFAEDANYSIDLLSGLPGLSLAKWSETLSTVVQLSPPPSHLSLYDLQVENGTVFGTWYGEQRRAEGLPPQMLSLPSEDECGFMYKYAAGCLKARGYEHYEVSSYAYLGSNSPPSKFRSQHNQIYWEAESDWYAVGMGATSSLYGRRMSRPRALSDYLEWVHRQEQQHDLEGGNPETSSFIHFQPEEEERLTDMIMTRLRTSDGLDLSWVRDYFDRGPQLKESILEGANLGLELGLAQLSMDENGREMLRLTDPTGFLYSNYILSSIFVELGEDGDK